MIGFPVTFESPRVELSPALLALRYLAGDRVQLSQ